MLKSTLVHQLNEAQRAIAPLLDSYRYASPKDAPGWLADLREANAKLSRALWAVETSVLI